MKSWLPEDYAQGSRRSSIALDVTRSLSILERFLFTKYAVVAGNNMCAQKKASSMISETEWSEHLSEFDVNNVYIYAGDAVALLS